MKDEMFTEEQLTDALTRVHGGMLASLPEEPPKHEFSQSFQGRMERLFRKETRVNTFHAVSKRVAGVLLALIIGAALVFSIHPEARASMAAWFKEELSHLTTYSFTGTPTSDEELPDCALTWMPEGLECVADERGYVGRTLLYLYPEDSDNGFTLFYEFMNEDTGLIVDMFDVEYTVYSVQINGNPGELYVSQESGENHKLVWFDESKKIGFLMTSSLEPDVILHIAEGIILSE